MRPLAMQKVPQEQLSRAEAGEVCCAAFRVVSFLQAEDVRFSFFCERCQSLWDFGFRLFLRCAGLFLGILLGSS